MTRFSLFEIWRGFVQRVEAAWPDVKDLQGFIKKLEANGVKLDRPYTKNEQTGVALAFITDPWGTYIELNQRPSPVYLP